ncbi:MAG: DUF2189 domain-containing protein [Pseudomonadota bacterium]
MSEATVIASPPAAPKVRPITRADIYEALRLGLADFQRAPLFGLFFGACFSVFGVVISLALFQGAASYWILPVAAGFPLIGPFAAIGLYEVSRRLEKGEPLAWWPILTAGFASRSGQLPLFAVLSTFIFLAWIVIARVIFAVSFGTASMTNVFSSIELFFTSQGLTMLFVGSLVGGALAALLFAISAIGVPILVDRDIDVVTAMITSVSATIENRGAMALWGGIVAGATIIAMLPLFLGMLLIFPMLGHAAWHVYRMSIEAD